MNPDPELTVVDPIDYRCLCGARVILSRGDAERPPCVLHATPTCADFDKREPVEFLRWLRQEGAS